MWFAQISERTNVHGIASLLWFVKDVDPRRCHSFSEWQSGGFLMLLANKSQGSSSKKQDELGKKWGC